MQGPESLTGGILVATELYGPDGEVYVIAAGSISLNGGDFGGNASLRDVRFDSLGGRTLTEEMADVTAESGLQVQTSESQNAQLQGFRQRLEIDRDAISGVDINEEMLQMMQTQRAYQAAAKLITTADQMLSELFQLVR